MVGGDDPALRQSSRLLPVQEQGLLDADRVVPFPVDPRVQFASGVLPDVRLVIDPQFTGRSLDEFEQASVGPSFVDGDPGRGQHFDPAFFAVVMRFRILESGIFPHVDPRVHHVSDLHGVREHAMREKACFCAVPHEKFRDDLLRAFLREDAETQVDRVLDVGPGIDRDPCLDAGRGLFSLDVDSGSVVAAKDLPMAYHQPGDSSVGQGGRIAAARFVRLGHRREFLRVVTHGAGPPREARPHGGTPCNGPGKSDRYPRDCRSSGWCPRTRKKPGPPTRRFRSGG